MLIRYTEDNPQQLLDTPLACNTGEEGLLSNVRAACALKLPEVAEMPEHQNRALICGGGPSLVGSLESIHEMQARGAKIFALNNVAKFLHANGIRADYQVIVDPREYNTAFVEERWTDELLACSQVHPAVFAQAAKIGYPVRLWHPAINDLHRAIPQEKPLLISVTTTVGLSVLSLVHTLGFRDFHLFGYDSSHRDDKSHAYAQEINANDELVRVCVDNHVFHASLAMASQASQFRNLCDMLAKFNTKITVHGDGLIPTLWRSWQREKRERILTAIYDLGLSPPTYDFLAFLVEAERYRRKEGFAHIDVLFQPGPMHGFRDDDLAPDLKGREDMLWRVCAAMCRLLPSVRNISVNKARWHVPADVFPPAYKEDAPVSHYGVGFLKGGEPLLRATDAARHQIAMRFTKPYATITLREASYWPDRNSNKTAWREAAIWLKAQGIQVVVVPDTHGTGLEGFQSFEPACFDIDLRAALYEGAVINMGVLNGPMSLLAYLKARYLIVKVLADAVAVTPQFLASHGYHEGDDFGGTGKMIWKADTAENILAELTEFATQPMEKTS